MSEEKEENIFDKIRREADEKRKAKAEERQKADEFLRSIKNDEITLHGGK